MSRHSVVAMACLASLAMFVTACSSESSSSTSCDLIDEGAAILANSTSSLNLTADLSPAEEDAIATDITAQFLKMLIGADAIGVSDSTDVRGFAEVRDRAIGDLEAGAGVDALIELFELLQRSCDA